ncbi:ribosomal protein S18 acetylase RimI-like enzyme [Cryobacterium mesophilum]|nr:GNAT family N-acetyltransferase [Terrimesophilobacter mesophilus]MBB5632428.1 ribosomal protein S18 acetylase RimI-like enzyme [Terrimesophilobacter mesophilus]
MELRTAAPEDWQASREIRIRALSQDPDAFCSSLQREIGMADQEWRDRLERGTTVLAWDGESAVGTVTGKADPHEAGGREIVAMWVDPACRGTGLADALISRVVEWAGEDGAHEVALWVAEDNAHARSLYERTGFALTGEREPMRPGVDQVRMRRELRGASD